jgi:hypothetical protein
MYVFCRCFQQYFSYIEVVTFIGDGNPSAQEKTTDLLQVNVRQTLSHNVVWSTPCLEQDLNLHHS